MAALTFSVVVTNYNYREFVLEAVDGALAQSRAPLEVIVVDDGSTDESVELLQARYGDDARVNLVVGPNGGRHRGRRYRDHRSGRCSGDGTRLRH